MSPHAPLNLIRHCPSAARTQGLREYKTETDEARRGQRQPVDRVTVHRRSLFTDCLNSVFPRPLKSLPLDHMLSFFSTDLLEIFWIRSDSSTRPLLYSQLNISASNPLSLSQVRLSSLEFRRPREQDQYSHSQEGNVWCSLLIVHASSPRTWCPRIRPNVIDVTQH
jgi:hypothetical protein